ncbi:MAG: hypothetical protein RR212_08705 [Bacteroidales bacterium]
MAQKKHDLKENEQKANNEAEQFTQRQIHEEDEQHFREWLKQHKVDHPEDAQKDEEELRRIFVRTRS